MRITLSIFSSQFAQRTGVVVGRVLHVIRMDADRAAHVRAATTQLHAGTVIRHVRPNRHNTLHARCPRARQHAVQLFSQTRIGQMTV
jgi:hypothetical protein